MSRTRRLQWVVVSLAALGLVVPGGALSAGDQPAAKRHAHSRIPDVTLAAGGVFSGRVVDLSMSGVEGAEVVLKQNQREIARALTDHDGLFAVKDLKGGAYQISSGNTEGFIRLWTEKAAPPSAQKQAVLVMGENGARGQLKFITPATIVLGLGVATLGTAVGIIATEKGTVSR